MKKDYHMHPAVVLNPKRFDAFARRALELGIEEICVTDHMPLSTSRAGDRIPAGRVEEYCKTVRRLGERYAGRISVKLGIEIDYHPDFIDEIEAVLKAGSYDFVLGASHLHVGQSDIFHQVSTWNEYARAVLENSLMAARSGYFDAIAHLDMYRWIFTLPERFPLMADDYAPERHAALIDRVLDALRDEGLRLEVNAHLAVIQGRVESAYPEAFILRQALEKRLRFCYGSDAHEPGHVGAMLDELRAHPLYGRALAAWEAEK